MGLNAVPLPELHPAPAGSLQISIDCRYVRKQASGIGAYVKALVDRLPLLRPAARFHLWVDPSAPRPLSAEDNVRETEVRPPANGLSTLFVPSRLVDLEDADVLHEPFNILGRGIPCPTVVTIHDLMWLESPAHAEGLSLATPFKAAFYADGIRRALRDATRLVAISRATADVIRRVDPVAARKVRVIPHGIEVRFRPPRDRSAARAVSLERLGIRGRYLLVVGQNTPSKNHRAVLEAFAAGVPVLASDAGGLAELLQPGVTGRRVPRDDLAALAEALLEAVRNPEHGRAMALNAYQCAVKQFSTGRMAEAMERIYDSLGMDGDRPRAAASAGGLP